MTSSVETSGEVPSGPCPDTPWSKLSFEDVLKALNLPGRLVYFRCPSCGGSMFVEDPGYDCARCQVAGEGVHSFVSNVLALDCDEATQFLTDLASDIPVGSCTTSTLGDWVYGSFEGLRDTVRELEGSVEFLRRSLKLLMPNEDLSILDQLAATASEYTVKQERLRDMANDLTDYLPVSEKPRAE